MKSSRGWKTFIAVGLNLELNKGRRQLTSCRGKASLRIGHMGPGSDCQLDLTAKAKFVNKNNLLCICLDGRLQSLEFLCTSQHT